MSNFTQDLSISLPKIIFVFFDVWQSLRVLELGGMKWVQNNYLMISFSFKGINLFDFPLLEDYFQINFTVYELNGTIAKLVQRSRELYSETMRLNVYENHFSLIKDFEKYCHVSTAPSVTFCLIETTTLTFTRNLALVK